MPYTIQKTDVRLACTNEQGLSNRAMRIRLIAILCAMLFFGAGLSILAAPSAIAQVPSSGGSVSQEEVLNELRARITNLIYIPLFLGGKENCNEITKEMPGQGKARIDRAHYIDKRIIDECTVEIVHDVLKTYVHYDYTFHLLVCEYTATYLDSLDQLIELKKRIGAPYILGEIPPVPPSLTKPDELAAYMKELDGWLDQTLTYSFARDPCPYAKRDCAVLSQVDEKWKEHSSSLYEYWTMVDNYNTTRSMWYERIQKPDCPPKDVSHLWTKTGKKRINIYWPYKYVIVKDKDGKRITRLWDSDPGNFAKPSDLVKTDKGVRRVDGAPVNIVFPRPLSKGMKERALLAENIIKEPDVLIVDEPSKSSDKWYKNPYTLDGVGVAAIGGGLIVLSGGDGGGGGAPTPTPPAKFLDMSYTATINFRNLRTSGDCTGVTLPPTWSNMFYIKTENGTITINQPSVNQTDTGPIDSDGNFSAAGANSNHVGKLNLDGSGNDTHTHIDVGCSATWDGLIIPS